MCITLNREEENSTRIWSSSNDPFLPAILVRHPSAISLSAFENEHMVKGQDFSTGSYPERPYALTIKQFEGRDDRVHQDRVIPTLNRINSNTITYDLAGIRINSRDSSEMLIDNRVDAGRSYFYNIVRPLLNHAAAMNSCVQLHAALVQWDGVGVLMPGGSGSGKSTLSILSAMQGHKLVTDDLSFVNVHDNQAMGRTLRRHFFIREKTFASLPAHVKESAVDVVFMGEKKHVLLRENLGAVTQFSSDIGVVLFPSITSEHTHKVFSIDTVSKKDAFLWLFQNIDSYTLNMSDAATKSRLIQTLQHLVKNSVCLKIETSRKLLESPQVYMDDLVAAVVEHSN